MGSSTCLVVTIDKKAKQIHTAYVGDSVYMILRYDPEKENFEKIHKAKENFHKFNQPKQLGTNGDDPEEAVEENHEIQHRDIIILASDG
jgi:hypothetical protein